MIVLNQAKRITLSLIAVTSLQAPIQASESSTRPVVSENQKKSAVENAVAAADTQKQKAVSDAAAVAEQRKQYAVSDALVTSEARKQREVEEAAVTAAVKEEKTEAAVETKKTKLIAERNEAIAAAAAKTDKALAESEAKKMEAIAKAEAKLNKALAKAAEKESTAIDNENRALAAVETKTSQALARENQQLNEAVVQKNKAIADAKLAAEKERNREVVQAAAVAEKSKNDAIAQVAAAAEAKKHDEVAAVVADASSVVEKLSLDGTVWKKECVDHSNKSRQVSVEFDESDYLYSVVYYDGKDCQEGKERLTETQTFTYASKLGEGKALPKEGEVIHKLEMTSAPVRNLWTAHNNDGLVDLLEKLKDAKVLGKHARLSDVEVDKTYEQLACEDGQFNSSCVVTQTVTENESVTTLVLHTKNTGHTVRDSLRSVWDKVVGAVDPEGATFILQD